MKQYKQERVSCFTKLTHTIWHCQYHIVWVPKYRLRILTGPIGNEVANCIRAFSQQKEVEIDEMNIQPDLVHILAMVPPKIDPRNILYAFASILLASM